MNTKPSSPTTTQPSSSSVASYIWVGPIDDKEINKLTERITLDAAKHVEINKLLDRADLTFEAKMRFVFNGPLNDVACVFVFDDFENGNLEPDGNGSHVCTPAAMSVLVGFAAAIAATGNESRVIVTSRYDFALPNVVKARRESLVPLAGADLDKKLRLTANLGVGSDLSSEVRDHAIRAAAGIPRLIERLDRLISDPGTDIARVLPAIDTEEVEYREELLAEKLLAMQRPETRRLLALAAIYQIPVPVEALAVLSPAGPIQSSLDRAVAVGLIDTTTHLVNGARYLVSNLLKPLLENIDERLTDEDRLAAIQAGCRCLYDLWVNT